MNFAIKILEQMLKRRSKFVRVIKGAEEVFMKGNTKGVGKRHSHNQHELKANIIMEIHDGGIIILTSGGGRGSSIRLILSLKGSKAKLTLISHMTNTNDFIK